MEELQLSDFVHGYLLARSYDIAKDVKDDMDKNWSGTLPDGFWIASEVVEIGDSVFGYSEYNLQYTIDRQSLHLSSLRCTVHPVVDNYIDFDRGKRLW